MIPTRPIAIRQADLPDLGAVQWISAEAYIPAYMAALGVIPKPAVEDYQPRSERGEVWLLGADGESVGLIVLEERPDHQVVYSIAVEPAQQGKGHARTLLEFSEQQAVAGGRSELRLYTNTRVDRNIAIYRQCDFVETGARPHPSRAGEELVDMVKRIAIPPASASGAG
jgi:ribosomal protein S18 acetylase RimI-like enzyme